MTKNCPDWWIWTIWAPKKIGLVTQLKTISRLVSLRELFTKVGFRNRSNIIKYGTVHSHAATLGKQTTKYRHYTTGPGILDPGRMLVEPKVMRKKLY